MKKIKFTLFLLMLFIFLFSSYKLYSFYLEDRQNEQLILDLSKETVQVNNLSDYKENKEFAPISVDFKALQETNKDIIGWVYQPNTKIKYPIVQGEDNNQYLRRLIDGEYNVGGTIFLDYRNSSDFSDFYSIVYGHNMKNKSMFGSLTSYKKQEYFDNNPIIYLLTPEKDYKIELFMGFVNNAKVENFVYDTEITEEQLENILELKKKSTFVSSIVPEIGDRIICLTTCSYEYNNARYLVFGRLKELDKK